jgi:hypothetical protein
MATRSVQNLSNSLKKMKIKSKNEKTKTLLKISSELSKGLMPYKNERIKDQV